MPRGKKIDWKTQEYDIGDGASVTVKYDPARRPKMLHDDTVVIIGQHVCASQPMVLHDPTAYGEPAPNYSLGVPRGGNFTVPEDDPAYVAFKASGGRGLAPAPPGFSPKVYTSEENFGMEPGSADLGGLLATAPPRDPGEN